MTWNWGWWWKSSRIWKRTWILGVISQAALLRCPTWCLLGDNSSTGGGVVVFVAVLFLFGKYIWILGEISHVALPGCPTQCSSSFGGLVVVVVLLFVTFFSKGRERDYLWESQLVKKPSLPQECLTIVQVQAWVLMKDSSCLAWNG